VDAANGFRPSWVPGDAVDTWLNLHEGQDRELSRMIERGWSWRDISMALFAAGICYRTGRPIPPKTLRDKASRARIKNQLPPTLAPPAAARQRQVPGAGVRRSAVEIIPVSVRDAGRIDDDAEPKFLPVATRDGHRPTRSKPPAAAQRTEPETKTPSVDDVWKSVFGENPET
jgi:hypothetical protein